MLTQPTTRVLQGRKEMEATVKASQRVADDLRSQARCFHCDYVSHGTCHIKVEAQHTNPTRPVGLPSRSTT